MTTLRPILLSGLALLAACAPSLRISSGPGSTPRTIRHTVENLTFEAPIAFRPRETGDGVILRFCSEPDIQSCGSLGIKARAEMPAAECRDREKVVRWLESLSGGLYGGRNFEEFILANNVFAKDASRLEPATLAGLEGWRTGTANRMLVLCDRAHAWVVLEISFEGKGREPARIAFDLFLRTARIEPAPTTAR